MRRLTLCLSLATLTLAGVGAAQESPLTPQKVLAPLPAVEDVKTAWNAPAKPDSTPSFLQSSNSGGVADPKFDAEPEQAFITRAASRVHHDVSSDGTYWVMGANYKASYGVDGFTFVPYLGADAPRNFPIRFQIESATLGGRALTLAAAPTVQRAGNVVDLDHGALVERHQVDLWSVEQTFVLADIPFSGDLEIVLDVESEFELTDTASGLRFQNEHGSVGYGDVTVVDAAGRTLALPSRLDAGRIALRVPAEFLASATLPVVIDPVVSNFYIDATRTAYTADTAYDMTTDTYLVTFEEVYSSADHDVRSVVLNAAGDEVTGMGAYVDFTTQTWRAPMVANNNIADQFLIVATRGANGSRTIWGRTRNANSTTFGSQFQISGSFTGEKVDPDVGGDPVTSGPTYYCVVWRRVFSSSDHDIHYQLVRSNSTLVSSSTQYVDNSASTVDFTPEVSKSNGLAPFSTQRWNVTFNRVYTSTDRDVRGAQIDWDGTLVTPSFSIDYSGEDHLYPQPSSPLDGSNGERDWACVYQRYDGSQWDVRMAAIVGGTYGQRSNLTDLEAALVGTNWVDQAQGAPHITADGDQFLVTYHELYSTSSTDWDIYCATVRHDGNGFTCVEGHVNLAFSSAAETYPRLTSCRDAGGQPGRFLVAWHDTNASTGERNIEGVLFDVEDTWRNIGTSVCSAAVNSTGVDAYLRVLGSTTRSDNRVLFDVDHLPTNSSGFFLMGTNSGSILVGQGTLCIGAPIQRLSNFVQNSSFHGTVSMLLDLDGLPTNAAVTPGSTWRFQYWFRDSVSGSATSNLSSADAVTFQ